MPLSRKSLPRRGRETHGGALESLGCDLPLVGQPTVLRKLEDAGADGAMAGLQADSAAAQEIGDSRNRFTVVTAMRADREDQVAKRDVLLGLFHGWKSVEGESYATLARIVRPLVVRRTFPLSRRSVTAAAASLLLRLTLETAKTRSPSVKPGRAMDLWVLLMSGSG
jgi:hypothetical protein